jgi:hypothetical protein
MCCETVNARREIIDFIDFLKLSSVDSHAFFFCPIRGSVPALIRFRFSQCRT